MDSKKRFALRGRTLRAPEAKPPEPVAKVQGPFIGQPGEFVNNTMSIRSEVPLSDAGIAALMNAFAARPLGTVADDIRREFGALRTRPQELPPMRGDRDRFPRVASAPPIGLSYDLDTTAASRLQFETIDRPVRHTPEYIGGLSASSLSFLYGLPQSRDHVRYTQQGQFAGWRLSNQPDMHMLQETILNDGRESGAFVLITEYVWRDYVRNARTIIEFCTAVTIAYATGADNLRYRQQVYADVMGMCGDSHALFRLFQGSHERDLAMRFLDRMRTHGYTGTVLCGR